MDRVDRGRPSSSRAGAPVTSAQRREELRARHESWRTESAAELSPDAAEELLRLTDELLRSEAQDAMERESASRRTRSAVIYGLLGAGWSCAVGALVVGFASGQLTIWSGFVLVAVVVIGVVLAVVHRSTQGRWPPLREISAGVFLVVGVAVTVAVAAGAPWWIWAIVLLVALGSGAAFIAAVETRDAAGPEPGTVR